MENLLIEYQDFLWGGKDDRPGRKAIRRRSYLKFCVKKGRFFIRKRAEEILFFTPQYFTEFFGKPFIQLSQRPVFSFCL